MSKKKFEANYCRHVDSQTDRDVAIERFCLNCHLDFSFDSILNERFALLHLLELTLNEFECDGTLPLDKIKKALRAKEN